MPIMPGSGDPTRRVPGRLLSTSQYEYTGAMIARASV